MKKKITDIIFKNNILFLSFIFLSVPRYNAYIIFFDLKSQLKFFLIELFILISLFFFENNFRHFIFKFDLNVLRNFKFKFIFLFIFSFISFFLFMIKTDFISNYLILCFFLFCLMLDSKKKFLPLFLLILTLCISNLFSQSMNSFYDLDPNSLLMNVFLDLIRSGVTFFVIFYLIFLYFEKNTYLNICISLLFVIFIIAFSIFTNNIYLTAYKTNLPISDLMQSTELPSILKFALYKLLIRIDFIYSISLDNFAFNELKLDFSNTVLLHKIFSPIIYLSKILFGFNFNSFELADMYGQFLSNSVNYQKFNFDINLWVQLYSNNYFDLVLFFFILFISFFLFNVKTILDYDGKFSVYFKTIFFLNSLFLLTCFLGLVYQDGYLDKAFIVNIFNIVFFSILKIKNMKRFK